MVPTGPSKINKGLKGPKLTHTHPHAYSLQNVLGVLARATPNKGPKGPKLTHTHPHAYGSLCSRAVSSVSKNSH